MWIILCVTIIVLFIIIGRVKGNHTIKKKVIDIPTDITGSKSKTLDLKALGRESIIRLAMKECNITAEEAKRELKPFLDDFERGLYQQKDDKDDSCFEFDEHIQGVFHFIDILHCDDTFYYLSQQLEYEKFVTSYDYLCTQYKKENYEKEIMLYIDVKGLDINDNLSQFLLHPIKHKDYIASFISEAFNKGCAFWSEELKYDVYKKKEIYKELDKIKKIFPYLEPVLDSFRQKIKVIR
ncbi:hypothetical protein [Phocaeicola faecalis]